MLFEPFQVGPHTLKNRMVAVPVFTGYARPDGRVSELLLEHYTSLAASGVAMVVVANAAVSLDGVTSSYNLRADKEEFIPGLAGLARAIQKKGSLACLQLNHAGRFARTERPLLPTAMDSAHLAFNISSLKEFMNFFPLERRFRLTQRLLERIVSWTRGMSEEDKERVISGFADSAAIACEAGFDMVELHGATGYLLCQFLSGYTHKPEASGEDGFKERMTFPLRVLQEVKRALPEGYPVGFRVILREWVPEGIDLAEAVAFSKRLEEKGAAYLSPSAGTYNSMFLPEIRRLTARPGFLAEDTASLTRQVTLPTVLSGRILTPRIAEKALDRGVAPLIGLGRVLRIDNDWVKKAGRRERVKVCVNCNQCLKRVVLERGFSCARWPHRLRERIELEHSLLRRDMFKGLWVVARPGDARVLKAVMPHMVPAAGQGFSGTILFLSGDSSGTITKENEKELLVWADDFLKDLGLKGEVMSHVSLKSDRPLEEAVSEEVEKGRYGAILMRRNNRESWQERFIYRQRGKVIGLFSLNPRWAKVIVPVDLSLSSLLVMRLLSRSLLENPLFEVTFVHALQGPEVEARKGWDELKAVLEWNDRHELRLLEQEGGLAETLMLEIDRGKYGTVVMGKRGLSRIKRVLLGSVSRAVLHKLTDQSIVLID